MCACRINLTQDQLNEIERRYLSGEIPASIAVDFGCSRDVIRRHLILRKVTLRKARENKSCIICGELLDNKNTTWYRQKNYIYKCNSCTKTEKAIIANEARKRYRGIPAERSFRHKDNLKRKDPKRYSAQQMRSSAKKRALALGVPFDLDVSFIESLCVNFCPILGIELKYGGGDKSKSSASLDRKIPRLGYVKGNVMIVSLLANTMKNEADHHELVNFAKWVMRNYATI